MRPGHAVPLEVRFARHLTRSGLLRGARRVLVAVSGGLDSVCLLHMLRFGGRPAGLHAAHFDHAMRPGSAGDALWVRGLCAAWDIPLAYARARETPRGEAAARELRYAFLQEAATRSDADLILTAHHADDQAETVLFRLARGTGLTGLAGIPARRGAIVRPLLPFTRAELVAYARRVGVRWREDPTNLELRYARNRIRHVVLPSLEAVRPGAAARIAHIAGLAAQAESAWHDVVRMAVADVLTDRDVAGFALARDRLLAYHPHVRARVLRLLLHELDSRPDRRALRTAVRFTQAGASGSRVDLAGRVRLEREFDRLLLRRVAAGAPAMAGATADAGAEHVEAPLEIRTMETGEGTFVVGGQRYAANWSPAAGARCSASTASFDPSSLRFPLELRAWRAGDRMRLAYGTKKLKKLFAEQRVGRAHRARVPVLSDATGAVLWAVGVARGVEATPRDDAVFTITVSDGESPGRA
jgi:tRNA(Ile)-lysidine synthase